MHIFVHKFGNTLVSRPSGKEALAAFQPTLRTLTELEKIVVDFENVSVLTPSWADEFITPLLKKYGKRIVLKNTDNPSVKESLKILERTRKSL